MEIHFNNFGPGFITQEQIAAERQRMIDKKQCEICQHTYLVNDQVAFCEFSHECVNDHTGVNCENWQPI